MNSNSPKISFIPKSSIAHGGDIFGGSRPKSFVSFLAIVMLLFVGGAYIALYYYNLSLANKVDQKVSEIEVVQEKFLQSAEIQKARQFNDRAILTKKLLDSHIVVTPIFEFLSENTVSSIKYTNFIFKQEKDFQTLELKGEAPSYSSLVNQIDILKNKKEEIASYSLSEVSLTNFGRVTFVIKIVFNPGYLSYSNMKRGASEVAVGVHFQSTSTSSQEITGSFPVSLIASSSTQKEATSLTELPSEKNTTATTSAVSDILPEVVSLGQESLGSATTTSISTDVPVEGGVYSVGTQMDMSVQQKKSFWSWIKFW